MSSESQASITDSAHPGLGRLTVSAVARRLGIAPGTLRTWDRRYGLGPTEHCVGAHRKYSLEDLARLRHMHKLVISGVTPSEAARLAVAHTGVYEDSELSSIQCVDQQLVKSLFRLGHVLNRKSLDLEIRLQIEKHGVEATWVNVLVPLLCLIGDEWERTGEGVAAEHMVTDVVKKALTEQIVVVNPRNEVPVLLACTGDETHSLAITALAAALAQVNVQVQFLGARTPSTAINEVVRKCAPPAIFLWAQLPENAALETVVGLPAVRPASRVILGGPGWTDTTCEGAHIVSDLSSARREILNALGL